MSEDKDVYRMLVNLSLSIGDLGKELRDEIDRLREDVESGLRRAGANLQLQERNLHTAMQAVNDMSKAVSDFQAWSAPILNFADFLKNEKEANQANKRVEET